MQAEIEGGWWVKARQVVSPNCDDRPDPNNIDLVVIHGISLPPGQFGGPYIDQLFTNNLDAHADPYFAEIQGLQVSAHVLIHRDGSVTQYVPFDRRAWHAGQSCFDGQDCCNDYSIGIELEGCDDQLYEPQQYQMLARLLPVLMRCYPAITPERICGHSDIAPGRKTDPGPAFDWARLHRLLEDA
jgi:AmpD protein